MKLRTTNATAVLDQSRLQVLVVFLEEFLVVPLGDLTVVLVEPSPMALSSRCSGWTRGELPV